jgi:hypothetical protein
MIRRILATERLVETTISSRPRAVGGFGSSISPPRHRGPARAEGERAMTPKHTAAALALMALVLAGCASTSPEERAKCAWMLWREDETKTPNKLAEVEWAAPIAYADRAACVAVINDNVTRWEEKHSPTQSVERASSGTAAEFRTRYDGGWLSTRFSCLPDTVDPRAPKGAAR